MLVTNAIHFSFSFNVRLFVLLVCSRNKRTRLQGCICLYFRLMVKHQLVDVHELMVSSPSVIANASYHLADKACARFKVLDCSTLGCSIYRIARNVGGGKN